MFEISKIAYDLYVQDWINENTTPESRLQNIREYYNYIQVCLINKVEPNIYENWLFEHGFNGSIYVCYEEFCDMEYHDKDYIRSLLGEDDTLIKMYYRDIEDYLEKEALGCKGDLIDTKSSETKNKYAIAKEIDLENFKNSLECLGYSPYDYSEEELFEMMETLSEKLAENDIYNAIYNETLQEVLREHNKASKTRLDDIIDKAKGLCEGAPKSEAPNPGIEVEI